MICLQKFLFKKRLFWHADRIPNRFDSNSTRGTIFLEFEKLIFFGYLDGIRPVILHGFTVVFHWIIWNPLEFSRVIGTLGIHQKWKNQVYSPRKIENPNRPAIIDLPTLHRSIKLPHQQPAIKPHQHPYNLSKNPHTHNQNPPVKFKMADIFL
jgi:hypothetical protein